jgi:hypothetical protein
MLTLLKALPALPFLFPTFPALAWQTPARQTPLDGHQALGGVDVPLARMPNTPNVGNTAGAAFLDYDGDGWIDVYVNYTGKLFRNVGGTTFTQVADLDLFLPPLADRYGAACGDFDNDGLPDIACEPRGDCFYLLRNLDGAGHFLEIATDPELVLDPPACGMFAETFCWADVDDDGDLDLWATAYQDEVQAGSGGNQFFENLGPTGPGGAHRFVRHTSESGLGIPDNVSRPEGAQFVDVDRDGDLDAYANGTLYQNVTAGEGPRFRQLVRAPTGITLAARLDEGVSFLDYDLDGDQDLLVVYKGFGNRIWENEGDGTFFDAEGVLERAFDGSTEGCSAEDWDLDGDLDTTTGHIFRRNLLVETGERFMRIATHSIESFLDFPAPTWGDWDKDGDLDCMLANWRGRGTFLRNYTYGLATPALDKLSVHVRPLRDSALVPRGLETEFGATVEVRVHDDPRGFVRRRFVASSHGYLQQSEYALTFALPPGPDPDEPARGVLFDLLVDFPSLEASGILRIDRVVNPVLGGLELAALEQREITVFRSGLVRIDGVDYAPRASVDHRLSSTGGLVLPRPSQALAEPVPVSAEHWLLGMELDTSAADGAVRVEELVLDGQLAPAGLARCDANVLLLDVTPGEPVRRLRQERLATSPRNDRSFLPLAWLLKPQRVYRVLCRVTELRASPLAPLAPGTALANLGALSFASPAPCDDALATSAALDPATNYFELRYRTSAPAARAGAGR